MLNMAKNKKITEKLNRATTIFGYSFFAVTVVTFIIGTLTPFASRLIAFVGPETGRMFLISSIISFALAVILPALVSYTIADRATYSKNKALHHYNGVLFGFAAYWISMVIGLMGFQSMFGLDYSASFTVIFVNVLPVVLTIGFMVMLAVLYAKSDSRTSVLYHRPFQVALIVSLIAYIVQLLSTQSAAPDAVVIAALLSLIMPVVPVFIAYILLKKQYATKLAGISAAIIGLHILWTGGTVLHSVAVLFMLDANISAAGAQIGAVVLWVLYLVLSVRFTKK